MWKLWAILGAFRKGREIANPEKWKAGQIGANALAAFLLALLHVGAAFGYEIPADAAQVDAFAVGLLAVFNVVFTVATSAKVGLPARSDAAGKTDTRPAEKGRWSDDEHSL